MPVTIDQLKEGHWWIQDNDEQFIVRLWHVGGQWLLTWNRSEEEHDVVQFLNRLIAPVAPYREKNNLIIIGWLANRTAYVNLPREEAIRRYLEVNDDLDENYLVENSLIEEYEFVDEFWAYDASGPTRVKP